MKPRIGLVSFAWTADHPGGLRSHVVDLAHALCDQGYAVFVHCVNTDPQAPLFETRSWIENGIHVQELNYAYQDLQALPGFQCVDQAEVILCEWVRYHQLQLVDVHHTLYVGVRVLPVLSALVPVVATLHDYWLLDPRGQLYGFASRPDGLLTDEAWEAGVRQTWPQAYEKSRFLARYFQANQQLDPPSLMARWQAFSRQCLASCQRLVAPSQAAASVFAAHGIESDLQVIENGIDTDGISAGLSREPPHPTPLPSRIRLGLLGHLVPSKGQLAFCEACLHPDLKGLIQLSLYGSIPDTYQGDPAPQQRLQAIIRSHPDWVAWHGPYRRDQLASIFAAIDCLVMPSLWQEVYGLIAREALCYGLPLIVTNAGALADLAGRSRVFMLDADQPDRWAQALMAALDEGPLFRWVYERRQRRMPSDAQVRTSAACAAEVADLYQQVLVGHPSSLLSAAAVSSS